MKGTTISSTVLTFPLDTHIAQTQNFTARCLNYLRRVGQVARRPRVEHQSRCGLRFPRFRRFPGTRPADEWQDERVYYLVIRAAALEPVTDALESQGLPRVLGSH